MNNKVSGILGIARRASKLSLGHDASQASIKEYKARLCITASDASDRLKEEFRLLCNNTNGKTSLIITNYTMDEIGMCLGSKKTAVLTVDDLGFAQKIENLIREGN